MYLSRVELDTSRRSTVMALSTPQKFHGAIEAGFSGDRHRNLWRLDHLGGRLYLLLVSEQEPDLSGVVAQFGTGASPEIRCYDPLFQKLVSGSYWRFRLTANPTKSCKSKDKPMDRGVVAAHCSTRFQKQWLLDRAEKHGFAVSEDDFNVVDVHWQHFEKHGVRPVTLLSVTYEGALLITDPEAFQSMLCKGIGRGKAYGLGMMTVIRR